MMERKVDELKEPLQREFESTALADRFETLIVRPELNGEA